MSHLPDLDQPDADARIWLEEIEGDKAREWVEAQNEKTYASLAHASLDDDAAAVLKALDNPDRIPEITRRGDRVYNFWKDNQHKRGIWRRTTLEQYAKDQGWETVLDLDKLAEEENEDWVWKGATTLHGTHDIAIVSLSRGGKDAVVLREYDIEKREFAGFTVEEAKGGVDWLDRDTLLVTSALGGEVTTSGYGRTIRKWKRGTDFATAEVIFEIPKESVFVHVDVDHTNGNMIFAEGLDFFNFKLTLDDGTRHKLDMPTNVAVDYAGDLLLIRLREEWKLDKTYAADTVLAFSLARFIQGDRAPTILFTPKPRTTVEAMKLAGGQVVLHLLEDLRSRIQVWTNKDGWKVEAVPGIPTTQVVKIEVLDDQHAESDGTLAITTEDPVTPPTLSIWKSGTPKKYRQAAPVFDASGLHVERYDAIASDGERIPYFVTGPPSNGDAPVHLTGYGGFKISVGLPKYRPMFGVLWLAKGGTTVIAALRGGGEFGTPWHEAGIGPRKIVAQDDLAAVAQDLVKRGITKTSRIAAEGGSNGGLLIANMYTRHPDKFGALSCLIPLVDMRRYNKLLAGASWMAEYGNPDKEDEWAYLSKISAYHLVKDVSNHPPIFVATTRKDDRVHPGHARKFAAKLAECGAKVMYHEPRAGGHGYGADNEQISKFVSLALRFLRRAIEWE